MKAKATNVFFVRHARSDHTIKEDAVRPLTPEGLADAKKVTKLLQNQGIGLVLSSPYRRSVDTVRDLADALGLPVIPIADFRERHIGEWIEDFREYSRLQWSDFRYKRGGGESLGEVQARNMAALGNVLKEHEGLNLVIGTHGTALSTILNHYDNCFGYESFWGIIDKMPYILHFQFQGNELLQIREIPLD